MKIIGCVLLREMQARQLAPGATIIVPPEQFRQKTRGAPHTGDLVWVQEPYYEYSPTIFGPQGIGAVVPGPRFGSKPPAFIRGRECKQRYLDGRKLARDDSRATLEVLGVLPDAPGISCLVHMHQIDEFAKAGQA